MGGAELPIDLILEILHRLPAKSLLRFQSVSKSWPRLIRDPNFIARHLLAASNSNSSATIIQFEQGKVHLSRMDTPHSLQSFSCNRSFTVIGSSNGLICLKYQSCRVIISNMLIKDHHMTSIPSKFCDGSSGYVLGFGYDSVSDDYKVVMVKLKFNEPRFVETTIYNIRSNAWSKSKRWDAIGERAEFPSFVNNSFNIFGPSSGVVASCGLHWLGRGRGARDNGSLMLFIIGFHLNREEFFELSLPDQVSTARGGVDFYIRMGVLSNCLCISSVATREQPYNDIWVMKEYGNHVSWNNLFRFETNVERSISMALTPLIHFPKEDQVLLYEEREQLFYLYDIRKRQQRKCVSSYIRNRLCHVEAVCSSTLVSLADYRARWKPYLRWNETLRKKRKIDDYSAYSLKAFDYFHHQFSLFLGMSRNL